jgi:flagellar motor switch protein FliN/FliY
MSNPIPPNDSKLPSLETRDPEPGSASALTLLHDVEVEITLEIGRRKMRIADVLKLTAGNTIELTKAAGEPLDLYVNGRLLGRGEAIVVGDSYAVRITEIASPDKKVRS